MLYLHNHVLQKDELNQDRRKVLSDEARRLSQEEPDLFKTATREFQGISFKQYL